MLNDKRFKEPIRFKCGAWIVKYIYNFEEIFVIIDDRFPYSKYQNFILYL